MKFFRLSRTLDLTFTDFNPSIPSSSIRLPNENATIPRVCLSDSIEGALTSAPFGGKALYLLQKVMPIRVYEFDLDVDENIVTPSELIEKRYVEDAYISQEYWSLKPIKPTMVYDIILVDYEFSIIKTEMFDVLQIVNAEYVKLEENNEIKDSFCLKSSALSLESVKGAMMSFFYNQKHLVIQEENKDTFSLVFPKQICLNIHYLNSLMNTKELDLKFI